MVNLKINGKDVQVSEGMTVLQAAAEAGVTIPTLCDHPDLTPFGGCRLCVVDVKGSRTPMASCTLLVENGLVVTTDTPKLAEQRRAVVRMLLSNYYEAAEDLPEELNPPAPGSLRERVSEAETSPLRREG